MFDLREIIITHQSRLSSTLDTIQSEEEWRGILAFFLVVVTVCLDFVEDERYTVLGLVVDYLDGHLVMQLLMSVQVVMSGIEEDNNVHCGQRLHRVDNFLGIGQ